MSDSQDNNEPLKIIIVYKSYTEAQKKSIYNYQSKHKEQTNEYARKWRQLHKDKDIDKYREKKRLYQNNYLNKKKLQAQAEETKI